MKFVEFFPVAAAVAVAGAEPVPGEQLHLFAVFTSVTLCGFVYLDDVCTNG